MLPKRPCELRDNDHSYWWLPTQERMTISVTGVTGFGKPPVDYSKYPEAAPRGTHVHRLMEALATGEALPSPVSPEEIDCSGWYEQLTAMAFWDQIEVLGCEMTMVNRRKSLGGQLDLLCVYKDKCLLVDLKTRSKSWKSPTKEDLLSYRQQFGGYIDLLHNGDDAGPGQIVDECRTLICTPTQVKWLPPFDVDDCYFDWLDCWDKYSASLETSACPF